MRRILFLLCLWSGLANAQIRAGQQYGQDAAGNTVAQPIGGKAISTRVPLAANATWSTPILLYNGNNNIQLAIQTNTFGSYLVEYYTRDSVKLPFMGTMTNFDPAVVSSFQAGIAGKGDGVKITYINGSTAQTSFYLEVGLLNNPIQATLRSVGANISASNLANVGNNVLSGRADSTTSASYRQATTSTIGNKVGVDMFVLNRSDTQKVSVVVLPSTPAGNNIIGSVNINGTPTVNANVTFPSNQQVTVSNASLPVTGTFFQSVQPVSGTVTANIDSSKTRLLQNVNVTNAYLPVTGSFYQATQPVSAATLPLPTGASTSANQSTTNTTLSTIATNTTGASTSALQTTGNNYLATIATNSASTAFTTYNFNYLAASGVQTLKSSGGVIGSIQVLNPSSVDLFIQFFNTTGTVTLGTTAPTWSQPIDVTLGSNFNNISGLNFPTGIKYAITTTATGNGAPNATVNVNIGYK